MSVVEYLEPHYEQESAPEISDRHLQLASPNNQSYYSGDTFTDFKNQTQAYEIPSPTRVNELSERIRQGDNDARNALVLGNIGLVGQVANKFIEAGTTTAVIEPSDLIMHGIQGLIRAAEKYDPKKGVKFSTYSWKWIYNFMQLAIADKSRTIKLGRNGMAEIRRAYKAESSLTAKNGSHPTLAEIAAEIGVDPEDLAALLNAQNVASINKPVSNGETEETQLGDFLEDISATDEAIDNAHRAHASLIVHEALEQIEESRKQILIKRFGIDGAGERTYEKTAQELGMKPRTVIKLEKETLSRLAGNQALRGLIENV
ncbi:sigma-70 family RNA polymerase sigma factor [Candidatus Saccharibacteria bacterium]|nr:sigma-70 family RNA polymerase sigma factor [Candidatus Saccharibacteria bacterium]